MILRNVRNNDTQMLSEYKNVAKTCFSPTLNVLPIFLAVDIIPYNSFNSNPDFAD